MYLPIDLGSKHLIGTLDSVTNRGRQNDHKLKKMDGASLGIIVENRDPMGLERVKIRLSEISDEYETDWIPVCSNFISIRHQSFDSIPKIGDRVLVVFEQGDLNRPIVIGCLSSKSNKLSSQPASFPIKPITLNSNHSEHGSEKVITEYSSDKIIIKDNCTSTFEFHTKSGNTITIEDSGLGTEKILIGSSAKIEMDTLQDIVSISFPNKLTIRANNIELEATETMNLKSGSTLTINGSLIKIN
jgi:hypothetical protein